MAERALPHPLGPPRPRIAPNGIIGMLFFIVAELMFFAALISGHTILKASALGVWPPAGQPRLPVEETAVNTAALLCSGLAMYFAGRSFDRDKKRVRQLYVTSIGLGAFFVVFQGVEWTSLIREGLTLAGSNHGGFFYLIVGAHALHAVAALIALGWAYARLRRDVLDRAQFRTVQLFWYFVVGLWPILYWRVYL